MPKSSEQVRILTGQDLPFVNRLLQTSEYIYQRFTIEELPTILRHYPAVGSFHGNSLRGFLLSQTVYPPTAWIAGFCVSWTESRAYLNILYTLLEYLEQLLVTRGVRYLHYSGNDTEGDWLRAVLLKRGFFPYRYLYAYDKIDFSIPAPGNRQVTVRPVRESDIPALLAIEEGCFEDLWRYDAISFKDIAATHPYFVVAELHGQVVGYQFNALDGDYGYLVRIAVHPSVNSRGIGARLMAEAIHFFARERVQRIMLNTQEENNHAHRLYEWFGFARIEQKGFVLRKILRPE
ncbi:MAG TPA: GNAT family N-acetyltransferase [Ktedonobacteraceae bacterium]|nr:GNAT family N-acetyltransferase [Ktedonobacteraceae bacterium]